MKRQNWYPSRIAQQIPWLDNFRSKVGTYTVPLGLDPAQVAEAVAAARWLIHILSSWLSAVRAFAPACTDAVEEAMTGAGTDPFVLPVFTPPALPAGVVPVPPGALLRIFTLVKDIKNKPACTESIETDLGILGAEDTEDHPVPKFTLTIESVGGAEIVRIRFLKYGHEGVQVQSKRGNGPWELLAIDTASPYDDVRPLLVAGQPEVREYRLCYWDKGTPNGPWTDVGKVTVS